MASQCFVEQYSQIVDPVTGLKLDGKRTSMYNMADNGAIKAAWDAYKAVSHFSTTQRDDKEFFYSFAKV